MIETGLEAQEIAEGVLPDSIPTFLLQNLLVEKVQK